MCSWSIQLAVRRGNQINKNADHPIFFMCTLRTALQRLNKICCWSSQHKETELFEQASVIAAYFDFKHNKYVVRILKTVSRNTNRTPQQYRLQNSSTKHAPSNRQLELAIILWRYKNVLVLNNTFHLHLIQNKLRIAEDQLFFHASKIKMLQHANHNNFTVYYFKLKLKSALRSQMEGNTR